MSGRRPGADERSFSLDELTAAAGVTVRTVRYYIAEGLLPPPVGGGPRARYTGEHLDRLRLIARMKEAYMPLKEIRRRLQAMTPDEIRDAVDEGPPRVAAARMPPAPDSAADYLHRVLREESPRRYDAGVSSPRRAPAPSRDRTWRRLPVTDEAELLITDEALARRGDQIEVALDWLRRILNER